MNIGINELIILSGLCCVSLGVLVGLVFAVKYFHKGRV